MRTPDSDLEEHQSRLRDLLLDFEETGSLSTLYVAACRYNKSLDNAGHATLFAHAVRELLNKLAKLLAEGDGFELAERAKEKRAVQTLVERWRDSGLPSAGDADGVAVPSAVYRAVQEVVAEYERATQTQEQKLSLILSRTLDVNSVGTRQIVQAHKAFRRYFHADPKPFSGKAELTHAFATIERALLARLLPFFETMTQVDLLLAEANALAGPAKEEE